MKSPPRQLTDAEALALTEEFVRQSSRRTAAARKPSTPRKKSPMREKNENR
jgi:hypothetical protein